MSQQTVSPKKNAARDTNRLFTALKNAGFNCKLIDLETKNEKEKEHVPVFIIQGKHVSFKGDSFTFQIKVDPEALNNVNKLQVVLLLQHNVEETIEIIPQTSGQLFNLIKLYNYQKVPQKLFLA